MIKNIIIVGLLAIIIAGAIYTQQAGILPDQQAATADQAEQTSATQTQPTSSDNAAKTSELNFDLVASLVRSMDKAQRDAVLADQQVFNNLISQESLRLSLLAAAKASNFASNEDIKFLLNRQADNFLVTSYVNNRLQAAGVPDGFPTDEQVQQFYDQNKQSFQLGERLPVWQIFWAVPENASKTDEARILKQASKVSAELHKGKLSFAEAASRYSEHRASSLNGGFMGILQTADLKPDVKKQILSLKEGVVSKPVRGENGIHVFSRGALLPARVLSLEQVRPQVTRLLMQALRKRQQEELNELARNQYPQSEISEKQSSAWFDKLASSYK